MQGKGASLMGQDWGCMPGDLVSPIQGDECVLLCPCCVGSCFIVQEQNLEAYYHSCSLVISVRSFGTHLHIFPALKSALSGRHFRSNEEVRQAVKNFLRSLSTDFYQDGFFELIPRYGKCINVDGEYVEK
ncbi:hypothetical protein AVEN_59660-1 [Araneus ventricosus]|uniref:Histone-lysine N-methyltransferase SETMAR n=1 Tax=Araneus ventricosus TaxID=182803 RepID=A0A4Y2BQI8_ARAVE|nr:hypothetical protein AVEN_59660-1 [Araneus ventricosus]